MAKVLIGRDATAYSIQGGGFDTLTNAFTGGAVVGVLGVWKDIKVEFESEWIDVTPSSADLKEKRQTVSDWKATLNNQVRQGGAIGLDLIINNDYALVSFTENSTGKTVLMIGGLTRSSYERSRGEAMNSIDLENVGLINGSPSIQYA